MQTCQVDASNVLKVFSSSFFELESTVPLVVQMETNLSTNLDLNKYELFRVSNEDLSLAITR
jgi:hypothetical protein